MKECPLTGCELWLSGVATLEVDATGAIFTSDHVIWFSMLNLGHNFIPSCQLNSVVV